MFACHPYICVTALACSKTDGACLLVFLISRNSRPPWRGEERPRGTKHVKRPYVWARVWAQRNDMPVVLPGLIRVCGRQSIMTPIILYCVCVTGLHKRACTLFSTGCHSCCCRVFGNLSCPCECAWLSVSACVCLSFCLISTSCFILGLIQTQHSCAVSQRKRAWGMGCQVLVSTAMLYNCDQQMEGKWGYQLGLIFSLWAKLTPHTNTIAHPLIWQ